MSLRAIPMIAFHIQLMCLLCVHVVKEVALFQSGYWSHVTSVMRNGMGMSGDSHQKTLQTVT